MILLYSVIMIANRIGADQTAQSRSLTCVFALRICYKIPLAIVRLVSSSITLDVDQSKCHHRSAIDQGISGYVIFTPIDHLMD